MSPCGVCVCVCVHSFWISLADCEHSGSAVSAFGWLARPSLVCMCACVAGWSRHRAEGVCVLERVEGCIWCVHFMLCHAVNSLSVRAFWHVCGKCFYTEECLEMHSVSLPHCRLAVFSLNMQATLWFEKKAKAYWKRLLRHWFLSVAFLQGV